MSPVRYPGRDGNRRDAMEPEIISALVTCGASVCRMAIPGAPDLLVGWRRQTLLVEVKSEKGKLNPLQEKWAASWRGGEVHVVRSVDDALRLIGVLASGPREAP